jgi:putative phosphoribosyl transferase
MRWTAFDADQGQFLAQGVIFPFKWSKPVMQPVSAFNRDGKNKAQSSAFSRDVQIPPLGLAGTLKHPAGARALVIFAHGSGSSRFSPRNVQVAEALNRRRIATLLFDLLLPEEEGDRRNVFDIRLLGGRLIDAVRWIIEEPDVGTLPVGLFGASTGAAAALVAASLLGDHVGAVVSRGGRPDLAGGMLPQVKAPTLLIVGGADTGVIELNQWALERLGGEKSIEIVPGATHLFPEPGALEAVIELAAGWFERHLAAETDHPTTGNRHSRDAGQ